MMDLPMASAGQTTATVAASILAREARLLDQGRWLEWLAMYHEDAVYWVPAWLDEYRTTTNVHTEVSLIYHDSRTALAERIARIESRKSITALPIPRTLHLVGNLEVTEVEADRIACEATFAVHVYDPRLAKEHTRYGRYAYTLAPHEGEWLIARKVITLVNDKVPTALDFYSI